jgi:hypothetical protein
VFGSVLWRVATFAMNMARENGLLMWLAAEMRWDAASQTAKGTINDWKCRTFAICETHSTDSIQRNLEQSECLF